MTEQTRNPAIASHQQLSTVANSLKWSPYEVNISKDIFFHCFFPSFWFWYESFYGTFRLNLHIVFQTCERVREMEVRKNTGISTILQTWILPGSNTSDLFYMTIAVVINSSPSPTSGNFADKHLIRAFKYFLVNIQYWKCLLLLFFLCVCGWGVFLSAALHSEFCC